MEKYKIQANHLQIGKWQPAYLPPQGVGGVFTEKTEFNEKFDTKDEADNYVLDYLIKDGVNKNDIEIL